MRHHINRLFCHDLSTPLRWHVLDDGSGNANVIFLDALYGGPGDRAVVHCTNSGNAGGHCAVLQSRSPSNAALVQHYVT